MIGYALLGQEGKKMRLEKLREHFHNTFIHGGKDENLREQLCIARSRELLTANFHIYNLNFLNFLFVAPRSACGSLAAI
jgi:hypothetical protein